MQVWLRRFHTCPPRLHVISPGASPRPPTLEIQRADRRCQGQACSAHEHRARTGKSEAESRPKGGEREETDGPASTNLGGAVVGTRKEEVAAVRVADRGHHLGVRGHCVVGFSSAEVPQADGVVVAAGRQLDAARRKVQSQDLQAQAPQM